MRPSVGENGLSENQFGFRKGKSDVDAIQAVVDTATKARRGTGKCKGFCALINIDIRNAFNAARWKICIEAMVKKKVPDCLLRMINDYLNDRSEIYEGDKWCLKEEMACGAPQGSPVGPLVWNAMSLTPDTMVFLMLQSERTWTFIESFVTLVMKTRELDGLRERNNGEGQ